MENASKAMYIAAGVLIGIMILGVFVYLFRAGGRIGENYEQKQTEEQVRLFNSKFEKFDKNNNTITDIISVTNLAIDNNEKNEYNTGRTVQIDIMLSRDKLEVSATRTLERNYLFGGLTGRTKIYVYDLIEKKGYDLNRKLDFRYILGILGSNDKLSMVSYENGKMNYKYLFKCTDIKYHQSTGRVSYMKFELYKAF